ncbi:craniofacial development protein 1 isoform X2 [Pungitius pungitius]|uniref:craniofacial development protein 1 isoform X2 n=1 Tax=Pungitius pungitius TaxID=134920 RepID=UPI0018884BA2|nr:craniofacial development protein 1 isoform X2 [Pungitius pungitius]
MNNYSDYDSDGYSSNEDADYVPSDENLSEDDMNECEREEPPDGVSTKKRTKGEVGVRKRKKGVLKVDEEERDAEESRPPQEEEGAVPAAREEDDAKQKKKSDDLWASFLSDVGTRPKEPPPASRPSTAHRDSSLLTVSALSAETKASEPAQVTITKVFDFAGEEVRVNKVVSADSKEAQSYLKSQNTKPEESGDEDEAPSPGQPALPGTSAKRPAGMSSILGRMGSKKLKMSTLEKSKMDWDAFKSEEGITEDLAIHNRGREGYVERKNFLERVDHRQFEIEKAVRKSNTKQ